MDTDPDFPPHPLKPGDWVSDDGAHSIAKVRAVYWDGGEPLVDLWMYSRDGERIGRESPAFDGPKTFEPACSAVGWIRIAKPEFPLRCKWIDTGDGSIAAKFWAGEPLPPANYVYRPRPKKRPPVARTDADPLVHALEQIAAGHNDPRKLAAATLAASGRGRAC